MLHRLCTASKGTPMNVCDSLTSMQLQRGFLRQTAITVPTLTGQCQAVTWELSISASCHKRSHSDQRAKHRVALCKHVHIYSGNYIQSWHVCASPCACGAF